MTHVDYSLLLDRLRSYVRYIYKYNKFIYIDTPSPKLKKEIAKCFPPPVEKKIVSTKIITNTLTQNNELKRNNVTVKSKEKIPIKLPIGSSENAKSLDSLYLRVKNCAICPLAEHRKNVVFGQGYQQANLMIIGEGPGETEDTQGLAFVGKAGKLLTQMLYSIGYNRQSVYITNVIKCRPPGNRNPKNEEIIACEKILTKQVELIKPKIILSLGNIALKWLLQNEGGIMKNHGKLFTVSINDRKIDVLPTFHPAFLLRSPKSLFYAWNDLRKLRKHIRKLQPIDEF